MTKKSLGHIAEGTNFKNALLGVLPNRARRRVRRARFFRSISGGKTIPPVRKSPGKSADFQISAALFPFHENPQIFMVRVKILFDTQGRGGVYVALGFSGAQAEEKQFRPSGNRPENPGIFRFPQSSPPSMKIRRFSWCVSKSLLTRKTSLRRIAEGNRNLPLIFLSVQDMRPEPWDLPKGSRLRPAW